MKVCFNGHREICFEEIAPLTTTLILRSCPLCRANSNIEELQIEIGELKHEIFELKVERAAIYGKPGREDEVRAGAKAQVDADI